jgi:hypothetical protein
MRLAMIGETGVAMLRGMIGSAGGYWARSHGGPSSSIPSGSSALRKRPAAEATFNKLRDVPDAPAMFISVDVCEIVGQA